MNKQVVLDYFNTFKKEDIINYCNKHNMIVTNNDIDTLYDYIKNNPHKVVNNPSYCIKEIQSKLTVSGYTMLLDLYNKYKFIIDKIK